MDTQETKIFIAILIIAGILAVILVFFLITLIRNQRKNIQLYREKNVAEITTLENERKRISADLHDGLGPLLSNVKFQIKSVEAQNEEDLKLINSAGKHIDDILIRIREISNDLRPTVLVRAGFIRAIEEYAESVNMSGRVQIICELDEDNFSLNKEAEVHLYRIVQEIINNAIKHAGSPAILVKLKVENRKALIQIKDEGKGFNMQEILRTSNGLGLRNIMSRVEMLKGVLYIDSIPGKGTVYSMEIPINQ